MGSDTLNMRRLLLSSLLLYVPSTTVHGQCDDTLPDGSKCGAAPFKDYADPAECSMFYHCDDDGCVTHRHCPPEKPLFHPLYHWCAHYEEVDCGDRPCNDPGLCVHTTLASTSTTTEDCGHYLDCNEVGDGWWEDPYNCRKYWHCYHGEGEHLLCEDDWLFNPAYPGCDYPEYVDCDGRPICGDCDEGCVDQSTPEPDCGHPFDCTQLPGGWYADPYNCRKYWHCESDYDTPATHFLCDDNLLYDDVHIACDFPSNVRCGNRPVCGDCDEADCAGCDPSCEG